MKRSLLQVIMLASCVAVFGMAASISAQDGASIKGKFVYDGDPPAPKKLVCNVNIDKDQPTCCKIEHIDESLLVDKKGGISNIVFYVRSPGLKVPDEIAKSHKEPVVLDNKDCRFEPRIVGVVKGQKLRIGNSDNVGHNSNIVAQGFNPIVPAGMPVDFEPKTLTLIGPNEVRCNIHGWMQGWVLVRPNPFFAFSDKDGNFEIKGLPAGQDLEYQVWHERSGFVTTVKLNGKATTWDKGRFKQKLKAGDNDLGEIKVAPKNFK